MKGRVWGGGGSVLGLATLLAALQTCRGVVLQHFGGDCKPRTPLCGGKGARACVPGGVQEGTDPPGVPVSAVRTARGGPACPPARQTQTFPDPPRHQQRPSSGGARQWGRGSPREGSEGEVAWFLATGGRIPSRLCPPHPSPNLRGCSAESFVRCAGFSLAPKPRLSPELSPLPHRRALRGQFCRQELTWKTLAEGSWQRCGAFAPSCRLPPSTEQCAL